MKISEAFDLYKTDFLLIKGLSCRVLSDNDFVKQSIIKEVGDIEIADLTMTHIAKWVQTLQFKELPNGQKVQRKSNTIRNYLTRIRQVVKYASVRGYTCMNCDLIPIPKREDVMRPFLTPEEVESMIENAYSLRNRVVISLLYSSGIRLSELLSLNRDSIVDRRFTVIGKGKKARLCFIDERTEDLITQYLSTRRDSSDALIVSNKFKARMTPTNVQLLIKNSAARAGITKKVSPHILRHSFATNFISNNGNIRVLSTLLGHSNVSTTMVYTHVVDIELERSYRMYHSIETPKKYHQIAYEVVDKKA